MTSEQPSYEEILQKLTEFQYKLHVEREEKEVSQQREEALRHELNAEKERKETLQQREEAVQQREEALQQRQEALQHELNAERERKQTSQQREEALQHELKAEKERKETSQQREEALQHDLNVERKNPDEGPTRSVPGQPGAQKRLCPKYLRHWTDFQSRQRAAFDEVARTFDGPGENLFGSSQGYREEASRFMPRLLLCNEPDLEVYEAWAVESYIADIWGRNLGTLNFQRRPGRHSLDDLTERLEELAMEEPPPPDPNNVLTHGHFTPPPRRRALDSICTLTVDEQEGNLFAIEYKAADILTPFLLSRGLRDMDLTSIIYRNKTSTVEEVKIRERAEEEVARIVTQAYDYMIERGVTYGYATGGEAFIQTAIGLVTSFARLALDGPTFDAEWSKTTRKKLPAWIMDDNTMMGQITPSSLQAQKISPAYRGTGKPSSDGSDRSMRSKTRRQRQLAAACESIQEDGPGQRRRDHPSDDEGDGTSNPPSASQAQSSATTTRSQQGKGTVNQGRSGGEKQQRRQFCTQQCLLGLVRGLPLDERCPNTDTHRQSALHLPNKHGLDRAELRRLLEEQLDQDADDEGFESLDRSGWAGALFRVTLFSHGYTFVGKGTVAALIRVLQKEAQVYERLEEIQGTAVPVYLGSIDLPRILWLTCSIAIEHVILLSWGGEEAWCCELEPRRLARETRRTVKEVQRLGVNQGDLRQPNLLWNEELGRVLLIDFENGKMGEMPQGMKVSGRDQIKDKRTLEEIDGNDQSAKSEKGKKAEAMLMEGDACSVR
ncbi:MAG: hypothetical protein M1816_004909 [Peltula sp. TS41687]|nr:MAG: hypothetical protein M1816_004909 [Peltula sp. TS41687]